MGKLDDEAQEAMEILVGLIDLENKVDVCRRLRLEFIHIWDMLVTSYEAMVMKATYGK